VRQAPLTNTQPYCWLDTVDQC